MKNALILTLAVVVVFLGLSLAGQPIQSRVFVVPHKMSGDLSAPFLDAFDAYVTWSRFLDSVETSKRAVIIWSGYGGYLHVMEDVSERLAKKVASGEAEVIAVGLSASAHAMVLCHLPKAYHTKMTMLMFHAPITADDKEFMRDPSVFDACVKKGILTKEDVEALTGVLPVEVWITYSVDNKPAKHYQPDRRHLINGGTAI